MKTSVPRPRIVRSVVALTAAYAVALQMLLGAVLSAQAGAGLPSDAFVICFGNGGSQDGTGHSGQQPGLDHDLCARLCAQAMTAAADLPLPTPVIALMGADEGIIAALRPTQLRLTPQPSPKRAQGPPQVT